MTKRSKLCGASDSSGDACGTQGSDAHLSEFARSGIQELRSRIAALACDHRPGFSLEQAFYTDPAIFKAELEFVWARQWIFVGHSSQIPQAGDYFTVEIGPDSFIVVRDRTDEIGVVSNVCRHRGSRICLEKTGQDHKSFVCPYHQWVYDLNGDLKTARVMPQDFDTSEFGLRRATVRVVEGLIFMCMASSPPDFESFESEIVPRLRHHAFERAKVAHTQTYEVAANWKLVVENSRECYHCGVGHPQYCQAVGFASAIGSDEEAVADAASLAEGRKRLEEHGVVADEITFKRDTWYRFKRFFLREGQVSESLDGKPVAPLMVSEPGWDSGVAALVTLPNLLLETPPDYAMTFALFPIDSMRSRAVVQWLVRDDAVEGKDYDLSRLTEFWSLTMEQDWALCENNHAGVASRNYTPGPYAPDERGVELFVNWYLDQIKGGGEDKCI